MPLSTTRYPSTNRTRQPKLIEAPESTGNARLTRRGLFCISRIQIKHRRARRSRHRRSRMPVQPPRRDGFRRPRRAALRLDRSQHGRHRGLDHAAPLRPAMVRKTNPLLLDGRDWIPSALARRVGRAISFRTRRSHRSARHWMACTEALWRMGNVSIESRTARSARLCNNRWRHRFRAFRRA